MLSAFLVGLLAAFPLHSTAVSGEPADSLDHRSVHSITLYSDNQWASNALTKWAAAGLAFGGDITSPVRTLTSRPPSGGRGGRRPESAGRALVLPPMNIGEEPDKGRWQTTVALEHQQPVRDVVAGMATFSSASMARKATRKVAGTSTFRR